MNKEIIFLVGISGSSKTTWATEFLQNNQDYLRINRDDIRKTLVGNLERYYQRKDLKILEESVSSIEYSIFETCVNSNKNVILDNTNLKPSIILDWINYPISDNKYNFKFKFFDVDLEVAEKRILIRDFKWNPFEEICKELKNNIKYIKKQYDRYQQIKKWILETYPDKIYEQK